MTVHEFSRLDHLLMVVGGHHDGGIGAMTEVDLLSLDPSTGYNLPDCIKNSALAKYPSPLRYSSGGLAGGKGDLCYWRVVANVAVTQYLLQILSFVMPMTTLQQHMENVGNMTE